MEIELVNQINDKSCVHACIAMVTGKSVEELWERYPKPLCPDEEMVLLIESKILPRPIPYPIAGSFMPLCGIYLISVPSLNVPGALHRVVVDVGEITAVVYDPQRGRDGKKFYHPDCFFRDDEHRIKSYAGVDMLDFDVLRDLRIGGE